MGFLIPGAVELCLAANPAVDAPLPYTADPSAHVWDKDGRLYLYCTFEVVGSSKETEWHVFSTCDLVNWTDHGVALSLDDLEWATARAWAPDAMEKDGKYYFYFPASKGPGEGIDTGVAVSNSPTGPFSDPIGKPLLEHTIDPCVLKDDDGQAYLYAQRKVVQLGEDMISLASEPAEVELLGRELPKRYEAVFVFKRNGVYYWTIAEDYRTLTYWMGESPEGPFVYGGVLMDDNNSANNHHSIVEYHGEWLLFYHRWDPNNEGKQARRVCIERMHFNPDGSIRKVEVTEEGVELTCPETKNDDVITTPSSPQLAETNTVTTSSQHIE